MLHNKKQLFISYSHQDKSFVDKLASDLEKYDHLLEPDYDRKIIKAGDSVLKILSKIKEYDFFLIILSKNSVESDWVKAELNIAKVRQIQFKDIKIIPVLIEDCEVPDLIIDSVYVDFRQDYKKGLNTLIDTFNLFTPLKIPCLRTYGKEEKEKQRQEIEERIKFYEILQKRYLRFLTDSENINMVTDASFAAYFQKRVEFFNAASEIIYLEITLLRNGKSQDIKEPLKFVNRDSEKSEIFNF